MRNITRILLSIFAFFSVSALGYYAYVVSFGTISFAFLGTEYQQQNPLQIVLAKPNFFIKSHPNTLDVDVIKSSLLFGNLPLTSHPSVSGEYKVSVSGEVASVFMNLKKGEKITLSADIYNKNKKSSPRLSKDIVFTGPEYPQSLMLTRIGDPKYAKYRVQMYGFPGFNPEDVRYYGMYDSSKNCSIQDSWDSMIPIKFHPVSPIRKVGQISEMDIVLDFEKTESHVCIIGGIGGVTTLVENRSLQPFSVTSSTLQILSPELDMKSQIEFRFSESIYSDTGTLYSHEYISNRQQAKINFLKHLNLSSNIPLLPENLILSPDRAIITLPLEDEKKYSISLREIEDVYGRTQSVTHEITAKKEPFLSLRFDADRNIYQKGEKIPAKLYALATPKNTYTLKLCQIGIDSYARLERIQGESDKKYTDAIYDILDSRTESSGCVKRDIALSSTGYVSQFDPQELLTQGSLKSGLYILTFANKSDLEGFPRLVKPLIFSVVDTHITMKVDASGKILILATDITTGKPLPDQQITAMRNITRTYVDKYDPNTQTSSKEYLPLSAQNFATGIILGKTNAEGFLELQLDTFKGLNGYDDSPYGLSFESWWEYEGRYDSFLVRSDSSDRMGLVVSTWNDGITGYNFGMKDSDYSYQTRAKYTSFLHTDRRLYLPGETVHFHAILRSQNTGELKIPTKDTPFDLSITDSLGREIKKVSLKSNSFGSIGTDFILPPDTPLGSYSINISLPESTEYIENAYTSFQVEIFKNPTFTAKVTLKSNDLENETIKVLRKAENTDSNNPWYADVYTGDFGIDGIVQSSYYNGAQMKNIPFTYRIYRSEHYADDYFSDCFWGCYYEPPLEFYTEGSGQIDSDGYGIFRVPVHYTSFYSDYTYTAEITIRDPLTGEEVTTPGSMLVRLPAEYKSFDPHNPLVFTPKKKILNPDDEFSGSFKPTYGKWDSSIAGKYRYELIYRSYEETMIDDIRAGSVRISHPVDTIISSGTIDDIDFSIKTTNYKPGEYHMRVFPVLAGDPPESSISDTLFYVSGDISAVKDSKLRVITDKSIYKPGDVARLMIQVPFTGSHLLITEEKGGILKKEYTYLSGNTLTRDIKIDDSLLPNAYIGVVALAPSDRNISGSSRTYAVGYTEIISDISSKKSIVNIIPEKEVYKNREHVRANLELTDASGNPLVGEITVMVVDESLIRLLGNIDLDIIPKFFQKFPFTMKTSLSAIGIERNRFLSRKGSNGGGGDKGGGGIQIASRTLFKNTAYYNPSIVTDSTGKARIEFDLPDNVTDYRIIAISHTLDSHFGVGEKTIQVRKDYVVEAHAPMIIRKGDTFTLSVNAFNSTKKITGATLSVKFGIGAESISKQASLLLNPLENTGSDFSFTTLPSWSGSVNYAVELKEGNILLDSLTQSIRIPPIPILENTFRRSYIFSGTTMNIVLPPPEKNTDLTLSNVLLQFSPFRASELSASFRSLLQYPYGCIEQTIASTLPNAFALNFADSLHLPIDREQAIKNRNAGLQKILRMQHYSGGWVYWEGNSDPDSHITPYVLRSLLIFRDLGISVDQNVFDQGVSYMINNQSSYQADANLLAESAWTLASLGNPVAKDWFNSVDKSKLSRHGFLAYVYAAQILKVNSPDLQKQLDMLILKPSLDDQYYWYWDHDADMAIYARLLIDQQKIDQAQAIITDLLSTFDPSSFYTSTQAKIQLFLTLARDIRNQKMSFSPFSVAVRGDGIIADTNISLDNPLSSLETTRSKIGLSFSLSRDQNITPVFLTMSVKDRPKEILQMKPMSVGGIDIKRTFELVDESRGVDSHGNFIVRKPVQDGIFQRGKLYQVTLEVSNNMEKSYNGMTLEDFFPGGWKPILGILKTESTLNAEKSEGSYWDHVEARDDRLLANKSYSYGKKEIYIYYIRPESVGKYLLPPATAYLMYNPNIHAYTRYEQVQVVY